MEEIHLVIGGKLQDIAQQDIFHQAYFRYVIEEDGLVDCHITVTEDASREEIIDAITEYIDHRDMKREEITNL
jgi:ribosome-interacting GTPase 1